MSGLEIRSSGAIAVDTRWLDQAAGTLRRQNTVASRIAEALEEVLPALERVEALGACAFRLRNAVRRAESTADLAKDLADDLTIAARGYELVDLRAARALADAAGDTAAAAALDERIRVIVAAFPEAEDIAGAGERAHGRYADSLLSQLFAAGLGAASMLGPLGGGLLGVIALGGIVSGAGRIPGALGGGTRRTPASRLQRTGPPPPLVRHVPVAHAGAPRTLAQAAERIPKGDRRVRVERYALAGGERAFAVYVAGTAAIGGDEPWNMASNIALYEGRDAPSLHATEAALAAAGARAGDRVLAFGHSQGAMIAGEIALSGQYRSEMLVTFGSPTVAVVDEGTLHVQLRHDDDPVAALTAGGPKERVGAADSFVATRTADPLPGLRDLAMPAHDMDVYVETATLVDESGDPRADAAHDRLRLLDVAGTPTVFEFGAAPEPMSEPDERSG